MKDMRRSSRWIEASDKASPVQLHRDLDWSLSSWHFTTQEGAGDRTSTEPAHYGIDLVFVLKERCQCRHLFRLYWVKIWCSHCCTGVSVNNDWDWFSYLFVFFLTAFSIFRLTKESISEDYVVNRVELFLYCQIHHRLRTVLWNKLPQKWRINTRHQQMTANSDNKLR